MLAWGGAMAVLLLLLGDPIARVFTQESRLVDESSQFLRIVAPSYPLLGVLLVASSALPALGQATRAFQLVAVWSLVLLPCGCWLGGTLYGSAGGFWGISLANGLAGAMLWYAVRRAAVTHADPAALAASRRRPLPRALVSPRS
jgi:Na+-driven multidrug efflux pump